MPPQDFVAAVALDLLGARVPARHQALRVEHEHRIVGHALDQQPEALLALAHRLLVRPALGKVARDLREAEQLAVVVAQRGDHHVRPEARAVLAHAPALVLEAPFGHRGAQLVVGPALVHGVARIEGGKVPADDLARAVALDALGAGVPGHDVALAVEHEYRVVPGLLDHELVQVRIDAGGLAVLHVGSEGTPLRCPALSGGTLRGAVNLRPAWLSPTDRSRPRASSISTMCRISCPIWAPPPAFSRSSGLPLRRPPPRRSRAGPRVRPTAASCSRKAMS